MSFMCFHTARFDSRLDDRGALIIFHLQNRFPWNSDPIRAGHSYLAEAAQGYAFTRWKAIDRLYAVLEEMKDNPVIGLNRAVLLSQTAGPEVAIGKLLELAKHPRLQEYYLFHALSEHSMIAGVTAKRPGIATRRRRKERIQKWRRRF
jgi:RNA polymerase sigma-70 factor (ECF subfamily)